MTDKKQKIIDAAIKLFVKNGIHPTSMQALAKAAGVATGSIYTYFGSKDELVVEIFHAIVEENIAMTTKNYDATQSIKERFYYLVDKKIRHHVANPDKFRFMALCMYEPVLMQTIKNTNHDNKPLVAVIKDGQAENLLKNLSIPDLFYQFFGGISSLLEWRLFNQQPINDADIRNITDMAWDSIKINQDLEKWWKLKNYY